MDRLPALALLLLGCQQRSKPGPPVERVNLVPSSASEAASLEGFCDVVADAARARRFRYPELARPATLAEGRRRWINVWATWCKPCIEEIPMLVSWHGQLKGGGASFDLVLLSLDADDASVDRFRAARTGIPPSLRIKDPDLAEAWVVSLGLDRGASIPIHVFVDERGGIRCARTGGVKRTDLPVVRRILAGG